MTAILKNSKNNFNSLIKSALCYSDADLSHFELFSLLLSNSITRLGDNGKLEFFFDHRAAYSTLIYFPFDIQILLAYILNKEEERILLSLTESYPNLNSNLVNPINLLNLNYKIYNLNPSMFVPRLFEDNNFIDLVYIILGIELPLDLIYGDLLIRDRINKVFEVCNYNSEFRDIYTNLAVSNNRYGAVKVLSEYFNYKQQTVDILLQETEKWLANNSI